MTHYAEGAPMQTAVTAEGRGAHGYFRRDRDSTASA